MILHERNGRLYFPGAQEKQRAGESPIDPPHPSGDALKQVNILNASAGPLSSGCQPIL